MIIYYIKGLSVCGINHSRFSIKIFFTYLLEYTIFKKKTYHENTNFNESHILYDFAL